MVTDKGMAIKTHNSNMWEGGCKDTPLSDGGCKNKPPSDGRRGVIRTHAIFTKVILFHSKKEIYPLYFNIIIEKSHDI